MSFVRCEVVASPGRCGSAVAGLRVGRRCSGDARHVSRVSDQLSVASRSSSTRGRYTEALVSKYYTPGSPAAAFMPVASDPGWRKVSAGSTVGKLAESDRWVGLERFPTVPWCGPEYSRSSCRERALPAQQVPVDAPRRTVLTECRRFQMKPDRASSHEITEVLSDGTADS